MDQSILKTWGILKTIVLEIVSHWAVLLIAAIFILGVWLGASHNKPVPENTSYQASVVQGDGSVIVERAPASSASISPPVHIIPRGYKEERRVGVTIGHIKPVHTIASGIDSVSCPDVTVDLSLVNDGHNGKRVIASSKQGDVVGSIDIPITDNMQQLNGEPKKWSAGVLYDPIKKGKGIFLTRDVSILKLGAIVTNTPKQGTQAYAMAGINF